MVRGGSKAGGSKAGGETALNELVCRVAIGDMTVETVASRA